RQNGNLLVEPSTVKGIPNATQSIIAREICGTTRRKHFLTNKFYSRLHLFVRNVGHLSAIYCMLFDRCGRVIDGRLVATLRGASAEISDLALDQENTLLAAGSCDKIIRVWSLQNLAPIAVLSSHTGMITALQFCPAPNRDGVLVSTGGDGCVAFWSYTRNKMDVKFNPKPLKLNERVRPGHAQLICASFSTGGNFLAVGGADHFVRVYKIGGPDGMEKLIETEIHTDRVDSIQWRHCGIEFVSGSRDGTALIWRYQSQQWRTTTLNMNQLLPGFTLPEEDSKKLQVTMVGWDRTDKLVITASSDHLLRVWDSRTGELKRILEGHEDNAYVIEAHPTDDRLILTAGHDGLLFIWDVIAGVAVKSFKNTIEGQGHGALFDAKWAPDGLSIATTDSHGHILIFGMGQNELFKKIPQELFFHTDYRPLVRDINHHVLDEQTQLAPHLMPPPFLVNIDGDPYPPDLQRLVPGRENCRVDQLIPNVVTNDNGEQEVLDLAIADVEHHLPAPIGQPPGRPPDEVRLDLLGGGRRNIDEMIERLAQEQEERRGVSERNRDELPGPSNAGSSERRSSSSGGPHPDHSYAVAAAPNALSPRAGRVGSRREGDIEGVRQSTGNWQRDPHMKWKRQMFVSRLSISALEQSKQFRLTNKDLELALYNEEIKKGPDNSTDKKEVMVMKEKEKEGETEGGKERLTRIQQEQIEEQLQGQEEELVLGGVLANQVAQSRDPDAVIASQDRQQQEEEEEAALSSSSSSSSSSSIAKEALEEEESSDEDSDNSTDYSDWTADVVGAGLEPPKRTAHKQKTNPVAARKRKRRAAKKDDGAEREESEDEDDDEEEEMRNNKKVKEEKEEAGERRIRRKRRRRGEREEEEEETNEENEKKRPSNARRKRDARNLNMAESDMEVDEIPPEFRLPDWLGETVPKKAPYFPQMGDEIMYFRQGHQLYVEAVLSRQLYQIDKRSLPWIRKHNLRDQEYVKIIGIKYEIKPPRLCCLKLGIMDMDGVLTGDSFTIKYHDMPDVLDFLVLKNTYDTAVRRNWKSGDRFRCIIDDAWWIGTVETQEPHLPEFPDSMFMCYRVLWDNGERERLSPWDMEPIDDYMELPDAGGSVQVSPEEYKNLVYTPSPEEWEAPSFEAECQRMGEGIGKIMELAAAEPFLAPVDLNVYPNYAMVVAYPMDLSTIKSRLESHFYRRPNAVQFDVRYIATNAEKFNKKGSVIVRNARIITELALRLIKDPSCRDPTLYYHEAQANYQSPSHSEDEERKRMRPDSDDERTRRRTRGREIPLPQGDGTIVLPKSTQDNRPWQQQCRDLLKSMFERQDSIPFRFPVDLSRFEDYSQVIDVPMDLSTIREELAAGAYASPLDFAKDVRLVFQNSKNYNTNNKSRIYSMTVRLEAFFEDQIKGIFARCKNKGKGKGSLQKGPRKPRGTSQAPSGEKPDNRTIMPPRLSLRTTTTAAVEQLKKSEIGLAAGPSGSCKTLSEVQINGVSVGASDISDDDDGDEALRGSVNEGGKRRSRRVARLRQLQDDDDDSDDEEYSPIKKNTQKSPRESRQTLGGRAVTGRSIPVAGTDKREKGGPVKRTASRKINFHDDDSDSGTTSKRSSPLLNSRSKRIRLVESSKASSGSSEISSEDESEDNAKPTASSTLDESHRPTRAPVKKYIKSESSSSEEEPPVDAKD
ncbi:Bromodomain and WD repeat-containing protein 3, partial [Armadillidium nasatum]